MPKVDQFESVFKSAAKPVLLYQRVEMSKVLVVSDLAADEARRLGERVREAFVAMGDGVIWTIAAAQDSHTVEGLLALIEREQPSLVCTYRCLHSAAWHWPHTLGRHLDVLMQATPWPVLVIPHPAEPQGGARGLNVVREVMAMTDYLAGDDRLVNWAVRLAPPSGKVFLSHIENQAMYERTIEVISKIPEIDTDLARQRIAEQLLKEPADYIHSCKSVLDEHGLEVDIEAIVRMGDELGDYRRLIGEREVDLLVMNTRRRDQLAMQGIAYVLSVQLRNTPLLLL